MSLELGDNIRFDINGVSLERLITVLELRECKYSGWKHDRDKHRLILFWTRPSNSDGYHSFMTPLGAKAAAEQIYAWLHSPQCAWREEPDHDGNNRKGWRAYVDNIWGHAGGSWEGCLVIEPEWIMYGK